MPVSNIMLVVWMACFIGGIVATTVTEDVTIGIVTGSLAVGLLVIGVMGKIFERWP